MCMCVSDNVCWSVNGCCWREASQLSAMWVCVWVCVSVCGGHNENLRVMCLFTGERECENLELNQVLVMVLHVCVCVFVCVTCVFIQEGFTGGQKGTTKHCRHLAPTDPNEAPTPTHTHTHTHTHTLRHTQRHTHKQTYKNTHTHARTHTRIHIHKYTHTHTHTQIYTHLLCKPFFHTWHLLLTMVPTALTQLHTHTITVTHTHTHTHMSRPIFGVFC